MLPVFPSIFSGKTLMYVHGFASSAQSGTVALLRHVLPEARVVARDIPIDPHEGLAMLRRQCDEEHPDIIVGTSMGGMYAEQLRGYDRVLINPAFAMGDTIHEHGMMGRQTFLSPRADGATEFMVSKALAKEYGAVAAQCFDGIDAAERERVWGLFGDSDPLVHTHDLFLAHYPHAVWFHGEHRLIDGIVLHDLIPLLRRIDDRQEGRERPVVYLHFDALHDAHMQAAPSMHKAFEHLLASYDLYIVAPAPGTRPEAMTEAEAWVRQYLSSPAHDRLICLNNLALLYGDYLVSRHAEEGFMGANVVLGSDEMKTWEDVITYFDRLGGQ